MQVFNKFRMFKISEIFTILLWNNNNLKSKRKIKKIFFNKKFPKSPVYYKIAAGLGGSVGCAVRLVTRRSRVQPPPGSATFFRGD